MASRERPSLPRWFFVLAVTLSGAGCQHLGFGAFRACPIGYSTVHGTGGEPSIMTCVAPRPGGGSREMQLRGGVRSGYYSEVDEAGITRVYGTFREGVKEGQWVYYLDGDRDRYAFFVDGEKRWEELYTAEEWGKVYEIEREAFSARSEIDEGRVEQGLSRLKTAVQQAKMMWPSGDPRFEEFCERQVDLVASAGRPSAELECGSEP